MTDSIAVVIMLTLIAINLSYIRMHLKKIRDVAEGQHNGQREIHVKINGDNVTLKEHDNIYVNKDGDVRVDKLNWMPY